MDPVPKPHGTAQLPLGSPSAVNNLLKAVKPRGASLPPHVVFPVLSAVFTYYLWIVMLGHGTLDELWSTMSSFKYADGTPLCSSYTGIKPLDQLINMVVAFEHPITNGDDKPSWLLMMDVMGTLQTSMLWVFMDALRRGRSTAWLA
jgi:hypothetical protein